MQKNKTGILSTASLNGELIQEAAKLNIIIDAVPFIKTAFAGDKEIITRIHHYAPKNIQVIFTSVHAVNAVVHHLKEAPQWQIFCIGYATKKLIVGFFGEKAIRGVAKNAEELGDVIINHKPMQVVFFCGDQRLEQLPAKLKLHHVITDEIVVYTTIETPVLITKKYEAILFFSPSAVKSFFAVNKVEKETVLFAIGHTTARSIQQNTANNVIIAGTAGRADMISEVMNYYRERKEGQ